MHRADRRTCFFGAPNGACAKRVRSQGCVRVSDSPNRTARQWRDSAWPPSHLGGPDEAYKSKPTAPCQSNRDSPKTFQDLIFAAAEILVEQGCYHSAALRHGNGRRHLSYRDLLSRHRRSRPWSAAMFNRRGATTGVIRRQIPFATALLSVSGLPSKPSPARFQDCYLARSVRWFRLVDARYPFRGGQLGVAHPRRLGLGWEVWLNGMELPVHLLFGFPTGDSYHYGWSALGMYIQGRKDFDIFGPKGHFSA